MTTDDLRTRWTLRDMDNRDDRGAPWEVTDTPERLAGYLDGPVRGDLTDPGTEDDLDDLIAAFREGDLPIAQRLGRPFGIYLSEGDDD